MADTVIIVGTKRGKEDIEPYILRQMAGRIGRKHCKENAVAHIVVEAEREAEIRKGLESGENLYVSSTFGKTDKLFFHIMPEIVHGKIVDVASAERWYSRSLEFAQGGKLNFPKVFLQMVDMGAVECVGDLVKPTKIGEIASDLYFHPGDVLAWYNNFTQLFELGLDKDNAGIAWSLGTRQYDTNRGDFGEQYRDVYNEFRSALPFGLDLKTGTLTQVILWWCAMGCSPSGKIRNQMLELRGDIGRIKRALVRLDSEFAHWGKEDFFCDMELMIRKGISTELLELCRLPEITKSRAEFLYNAGVRIPVDLFDLMGSIEDEIDEPFKESLRKIMNDISRTNN